METEDWARLSKPRPRLAAKLKEGHIVVVMLKQPLSLDPLKRADSDKALYKGDVHNHNNHYLK